MKEQEPHFTHYLVLPSGELEAKNPFAYIEYQDGSIFVEVGHFDFNTGAKANRIPCDLDTFQGLTEVKREDVEIRLQYYHCELDMWLQEGLSGYEPTRQFATYKGEQKVDHFPKQTERATEMISKVSNLDELTGKGEQKKEEQPREVEQAADEALMREDWNIERPFFNGFLKGAEWQKSQLPQPKEDKGEQKGSISLGLQIKSLMYQTEGNKAQKWYNNAIRDVLELIKSNN